VKIELHATIDGHRVAEPVLSFEAAGPGFADRDLAERMRGAANRIERAHAFGDLVSALEKLR
jgi:hypothetical protein